MPPGRVCSTRVCRSSSSARPCARATLELSKCRSPIATGGSQTSGGMYGWLPALSVSHREPPGRSLFERAIHADGGGPAHRFSDSAIASLAERRTDRSTRDGRWGACGSRRAVTRRGHRGAAPVCREASPAVNDAVAWPSGRPRENEANSTILAAPPRGFFRAPATMRRTGFPTLAILRFPRHKQSFCDQLSPRGGLPRPL